MVLDQGEDVGKAGPAHSSEEPKPCLWKEREDLINPVHGFGYRCSNRQVTLPFGLLNDTQSQCKLLG